MSTESTEKIDREQEFNAILLTLVKAMERGETPDRKAFLAAHPQFASELEEFFAGRDFLNRLAGAPAAPPKARPVAPDLGTLGDFRLMREVGRGGMGIVYEARQISLDRSVALKVLPFAASLDPRQLQRFKNEAHAAALLHHPHIVSIYSVGSERNVHYYAMQLIQGHSLATMIRGLRESRSGKVTPPEKAVTTAAQMSTAKASWRGDYFRRVAQFGIDAAEALDHAHQLGVVHRDIKPANLLVDNKGQLWITDFGVALLQRNEGMTTTGELVGTLRYMSPEQAGASRGHVDHRTDVYSLGATLYELLTLTPAVPGDDPHRILQDIVSLEPAPLRSLDRAIPAILELIVLKALSKSPAERYGTAQELADDLRRFLEEKPVRATRPSLVDRAVKWSRRHRALVGSALAMVALTMLGLLVSTVLIGHAHGVATASYEREKLKTKEAQDQRNRAEKNLEHARDAVEFLTQVSVDELSDRPEFMPVRQKILTAALDYYAQFLDDHQDDASIRAELDASSKQVKHLLTVLNAQAQYTQLMMRAMLLAEPAVQKDLKITPAQKEKLLTLTEQLKSQNREAFHIGAKLSDEQERGKKFKDLAAANEKVLTAILTPQQTARLKQIAVQQHGILGFLEPEVVAALRLEPDQKSRIRDMLEDTKQGHKAIYANAENLGEADRKAKQLIDQTELSILGELTAPQRTTWTEMTGEPFNSRIEFLAELAFAPRAQAEVKQPPHHERKGFDFHMPQVSMRDLRKGKNPLHNIFSKKKKGQ